MVKIFKQIDTLLAIIIMVDININDTLMAALGNHSEQDGRV